MTLKKEDRKLTSLASAVNSIGTGSTNYRWSPVRIATPRCRSQTASAWMASAWSARNAVSSSCPDARRPCDLSRSASDRLSKSLDRSLNRTKDRLASRRCFTRPHVSVQLVGAAEWLPASRVALCSFGSLDLSNTARSAVGAFSARETGVALPCVWPPVLPLHHAAQETDAPFSWARRRDVY